MSKVFKGVKSAVKSVGDAVSSIGKEVGRGVESVGKEAKRFAKSDLGKAAMTAAAAYFGGPALMGAMGSMGAGGAAASGAAATGAGTLGVSGGISSGAISAANAVAGGGAISGAASTAASTGVLSKLKGAAGSAFSWMEANPNTTLLAGNALSGAAQGYMDKKNLRAQQAHERDMVEESQKPRIQIGNTGNYGSHVGLLRSGMRS